MKQRSALEAIIIFIVGIYFSIPGSTNIGYMLIEALADSPASKVFPINLSLYKVAFSLFWIAITMEDIFYIIRRVKEGNFF